MLDIPHFCVLVGANGSGKSTLFQVFAFLKEALASNVRTALIKLGGSMGFREVRSRNCKGNIEIEVKFRERSNALLVTYFLSIGERNGEPFVEREILKYRRGSSGQPWHFLDFSEGKQELEKQLPLKLRAWRLPDCKFVVLRDKDSGDCVVIRKGLVKKCNMAGLC